MESIKKQYLTGGEVISVEKLVNKRYPNDYIHFSLSPDWAFYDKDQKTHYGFKPKGLWMGKGTSWLDYLQRIDWYDKITEYTSVFRVEVDESKVITLRTKEEYLDFTKLYGEKKTKNWEGKYSVISNIDWFRVAKDYDGIRVVNPNHHKFDDNISWVYGWDISSVCIWNDDAIKSHDLIFEGQKEASTRFGEGGIVDSSGSFEKGGMTEVGSFEDGVCTYDFEGYKISEAECADKGIKYLMPKEYPAVAQWLFENHFPLWLYYNYLHRLSISYSECKEILSESNDFFKPYFSIRFNGKAIKRSNASWQKQPWKPEGRKGGLYRWKEYKGWFWAITLNLAKDSAWTDSFRNKKTGLPLPQYEGDAYSLTTLLHELAHCYDFVSLITNKVGNISGEWKPLSIHKDTFLVSLYKIIKACRDGGIPVVKKLDDKGIKVQFDLENTLGDKILRDREGLILENEQKKKDKALKDNTQFSWQTIWNKEIVKFITSALPKSNTLYSKVGTKENLSFENLLILDHLILAFEKNKYKRFIAENPNKAELLRVGLVSSKREIERLKTNHQENMEANFKQMEESQRTKDAFKGCNKKTLTDWFACMKSKFM